MRKIFFSVFILFTKISFAQNVTASFTSQDTVCTNSSVNIQNTSVGASTYFWNFCTANINQPPIGTNLGNPGGQLSAPVYIDYVYTNGNYYGFVTNNSPGGLLRLEFGNSLLNTPVVTNLGSIGGVIPNNTEGVQIANDNGKWYVLIVGGEAASGSVPSLTTVSLGTSITNNAPIATNWGNIGDLSYPHDLYVFNDNGHWYGLTVNYSNSTVTRFDLTISLSNTPTATNLGNIGGLSGPTGIQAINDNGNWRVFVTNATSSTLTRLDFGSSLLNTPTGINLGNPNNAFVTCWDIYTLRYCGENEAFVINANGTNDIVKLDFGSSLVNNPTAVSLGNQGNLSFPHSLSKLFRVGADVFSLITNVNNNTLSLLQFPGCINASVPNSTAQNPPAITYDTPGTYNINLTVDDGLPTQTSYCKQVVVENCEKIINDYTEVLGFNICKNELTVTDASKYNPGDTVLLIQMKGAVIDSSNTSNFGTVTDYKNAGNYEYNYVKQKTGNIIQLKNLVTRQYDIPIGKVQLIRVPYYDNLTIDNKLTCLQWNGSKGGVLAFNVKNTLTMNADIDVRGKGFMGGQVINPKNNSFYCHENNYYYPNDPIKAAPKGEGIAIVSDQKSFGKGALSNGGGGGLEHNSGGGGGSNITNGGLGGKEWINCGPPINNNGIGGKSLVYSNILNKIFLGGGGGAGHCDNLPGFNPLGGNGGGIIIIKSNSIKTNNNLITADGQGGIECFRDAQAYKCHEGMGGGGGGGTILVDATNFLDNTNIQIKGGKGADMNGEIQGQLGPGGGGGGGVCWLSNAILPGNISITQNGGMNGINIDFGNDPYGATPGQTGTNLFSLKIPIDTILFKPNIDSVRIKDSATSCTRFDFKGMGYTNTSAINSWQWSFGDGSADAQQNTSHTYTTSGNFNVKLIVTDVNGCKDSISKSITTSAVNIIKSKDTSLCGSSTVQLLAGGGVSYSWLPVPGLSNTNIPNPLATPTTTTTYYVTVTNALGCSKTDSIKISVNSFPTISKSNDTSICQNTPLQLAAGGGSTDSWTPSSTLNNSNISNPVATPTSTTRYYVTVTNSAGCSKKDSILVATIAAPIVTKSGDTSICYKSSIQLIAGGGASYTWSPASSLNNSSINNPVATPLATTIYYVTVANAIGCSKKDSIKVIVNALPVISKSKDTGVCNNVSVQLFANGGTSYSWTPTSSLNNPNIANPVASPGSSTVYYVTVTNAQGCAKMDSVKIVTSSPPVITKSGDMSICKNTSVQLFASGGSTYSWTPASTLNNAGIANPIASPNSPTTYYITVINGLGCSKKDSVKIDINPAATITKSNDITICNQASVRIFAAGGTSYLWSPALSLDDPTSPSPLASPAITTLYKVAIKDAYSCSYEDSVKVSVKSAAVFTITPDGSVCKGILKQLQASGGDTYLWSPTDGLNNPNIDNPVASPTSTTTYTVTIHENTCNQTGTLSTNVTILSLPIISATSSNDLSCSLGSSQLNATGGISYIWSPGTGLNNSNIANPIATPSATTLYTVTGKDANGCSNSDTVTVKADYNMNALYLLPNSFTPNGDGINDCFGIKYWGVVQNLDFSIYNRFGERVFHTTDPSVCWNGTYKQKLQDVNVFVYVITAKTACGIVNRKGTVSLLK